MANGLINLQTDLKSLRYGSMPLGSDTPYVTKDINNPPSSNLTTMEITKRIDDTSRIAQMLVDRPGLKYLFHEAELKQIDVASKIKNRGNKSVLQAVLGQLGNTAVGVAKIIGSTLAQVPVNGTGTHFIKEFRTDTYLQPSGGNTASAFMQFFGAGGIEGAQYALRGELVPGVHESELTGIPSEYDYDDKVNTQISRDSQNRLPKQLAEDGKNIKTRGTTPTSYVELTSISNKTSGSLGVLEPTPTNKYTADSTFTGTDTLTSTLNAQTGSVVKVIPGDGTFTNINGEPSQHLDSTAEKGRIGIPNKLKDIPNVTGYQNPSIFTTEDQLPGPPPEYTQEGTYLSKEAKQHQETWGEPLKDSTTNFTHPGRTSEISGSDPTYLHPSIATNKYLGNSDRGPLPDPSLFADGKLATYSEFQSKKQLDSWGQPMQDTTAASGSIGRSTERSAQDSVPRFLPHIVASNLEEVTPPPTYRPQDTYLARKRAVTTQGGSVVRESRVNLGDQGGRNDINKLTNAYWTTSESGYEIDLINALDVQETKVNGGVEGRDLVKFRFHVLTPDSERVLYFRAHLDTFTDNYTGQWSPVKYLGRAEDFQIYSGFQRKINLSFKIAAATRVEMRSLYRKMVYLASATAPTYGGDVQFMRGTIVKLTLGDYVYELPGTLNSLTYSWNQDYPWEIAMLDPENDQGDDSMQELPMVLDCTMDFTPIHTFTPVTGLRKYITSGTSKNNDYFLDTSDPLLDTLATAGGRAEQTTTPSDPTTFGPQPQPTTNAFGFPI